MKTSYLVTGPAGCIGQAVMERLHTVGAEVTGLDVVPLPAAAAACKWILGDICDPESYRDAFRGVEVVVHLAAKVHSIPKTGDEAAEFWRVNLEGTRGLLTSAVEHGVRRFVHVSTVAAIAQSTGGLASAYADSKRAAERVVLNFGDRIEVVIVRPATVYGPKDRGNVYKLIRWLDRGLPAIIGHGDNRKSLVYVSNLSRAILHLSERGRSGEAYVVTDGRDQSLREIVQVISTALGKQNRWPAIPGGALQGAARVNEWLERRFGLPKFIGRDLIEKLLGESVFDPSPLLSTGFVPNYSFEEGIEETVRWYRDSLR